MAGTDLYWGHGERALLALAQALRIPVFLNGLARGCVPADHELFFSRARSQGAEGADVALVIGVPMDFRLGFGASFGEDTEIVVSTSRRARAPPPARGRGRVLRGAPRRRSRDLLAAAGQRGARERAWVAELRAAESERRAAERAELRGRSRAAAPDAPLRRARRGCSTATRS